MEILVYKTGMYKIYMLDNLFNRIKETISVVLCDDLYIVMRVSEAVSTDYSIPIETKYTKSYAVALDWYKEWDKVLMNRMVNVSETLG